MEPTVSDVQPAVDSVPILLEPGERTPFDESVAAGLVGLVYLAKQAQTEKRRKQCLEITNAILKIDPQHAEARTIQASMRSELGQEFANAKDVVREAQSKDDPTLYGQAAATLRRIIDADPDNLEAQSLLHKTVAAGHACASSPPEQPNRTIIRRSAILGSVALVLIAALTLLSGTNARVLAPPPAGITTLPVTSGATSTAGTAGRADLMADGAQVALNDSQTIVVPLSESGNVPVARVTRTELTRAAAPLPVADAGAASSMGDLAVSAAVPVEIYRGEEHLGSTPTTLHLPAGPQTLEYRYQGFRQTLTTSIKNQETTTANIAFPIRVQINAKPWAQVFIDGVKPTAIGQTPLGDVSVPIGSVLVFQNPGFPDKRYRVTAKDTTIQMSFP